jgi:hypothetical protein
MRQYLLSVHDVAGRTPPSAEATQRAYQEVAAFNSEVQDAGAWVFAGGLQPPDEATVVRLQDGKVLATDGPFAEGKEHIGGFWVISVADLDTALAWAAKATQACAQPVEVRPFQAGG